MNLYEFETKELLEINTKVISKNTTKISPPKRKEGYAICFNLEENKWEYRVDNRDKIYYLNKMRVDFKIGDIISDDMTLDKYTESELYEKKIFSLQLSLITLCDKMQEDFLYSLLKHKNTKSQAERYHDKYQRALLNEFDDIDNALIIKNHEVARNKIRIVVDMIEYFRITISNMIKANDLLKANTIINRVRDSHVNITTVLEMKIFLSKNS
tara:strand:+ start:7313 stop:7948 length:636 start_codon:yes stop_codon:yes gene_type:complete